MKQVHPARADGILPRVTNAQAVSEAGRVPVARTVALLTGALCLLQFTQWPPELVAPSILLATSVTALVLLARGVRLLGPSRWLSVLLATEIVAGVVLLVMLAGLKVLALSLCLAAGWRGGAIFPLLFAGAAAGAAVAAAIPLEAPVSAGLLAGMTAAATLGMGRPVAAVLIVAFLVSPTAIGPLSVGALTADHVFTNLFDRQDEQDVGHIRLAREADLIVVAPATADLIAKLAQGLAGDADAAVADAARWAVERLAAAR